MAFVAALFIGYGVLREKRAKETSPAHATGDAHTLFLPDLGLTMADGGRKVTDEKVKEISETGLTSERDNEDTAMRCPFLREAQVKSCRGSAFRKMICPCARSGRCGPLYITRLL